MRHLKAYESFSNSEKVGDIIMPFNWADSGDISIITDVSDSALIKVFKLGFANFVADYINIYISKYSSPESIWRNRPESQEYKILDVDQKYLIYKEIFINDYFWLIEDRTGIDIRKLEDYKDFQMRMDAKKYNM